MTASDIIGTLLFAITFFVMFDHESPNPSWKRVLVQIALALVCGYVVNVLLSQSLGYEWDGTPEPHM